MSMFPLSAAVGFLFSISIISISQASSNDSSISATCIADAASTVRAFDSATATAHAALGSCYIVLAADFEACSVDVWRRPRFVILMKRMDDTHSKLKIITNDEVIEAEKYLTERNPKNHEYIRVKINDRFVPFNAYSMNSSKVDDLVTVNYVNHLTGIELQNGNFWIRFNGVLMEIRRRKSDELAICGWCGNSSFNYIDNVHTQLSENGLLKDEPESCRLRVADPPQGKCETSASSGIREFNANYWTPASQLSTPINGCYAVIAADAPSCVHGFTEIFTTTARRPRYAILMRQFKDIYSKLKVITDSEVIEIERLIGEHTPMEQRLLRVIINGERIPYNAYSMAYSVVDNLCTVEFMSNDFSVVELQNRDFWLRFDGIRLELRLLKHADALATAACGICHKRSDVVETGVLSAHKLKAGHTVMYGTELVRASLVSGGFLKDENALCHETMSFYQLPWTGANERTTSTSILSDLNETTDDIKNLMRPITAIVINVKPTRICLSTRAIKHCVFPMRPIFLKRINGGSDHRSTEHVEFVCVSRAHNSAQKLLDFADRRRRLLTNASGASEIRAIERNIMLIQHSNAINQISVPSETLRHYIPDYCSRIVENTT